MSAVAVAEQSLTGDHLPVPAILALATTGFTVFNTLTALSQSARRHSLRPGLRTPTVCLGARPQGL